MKYQENLEISALAIRKAIVADADKVRYRVYRTSEDFVAVIAESALMAMKVAGIERPHRIVRDLPTTAIAIESERMAKIDAANVQKVILSLATHSHETSPKKVVLSERSAAPSFAPMVLGDFEKIRHEKSEVGENLVPPVNGVSVVEPQESINAAATQETVSTQPAAIKAKETPIESPPIPDSTPLETMTQTNEVPSSDGKLSPEEVERLLSQ